MSTWCSCTKILGKYLSSVDDEACIYCETKVGYTNAGKSTLLNQLTGANVLAEDRLFATLDPTTRRVQVSSIGLGNFPLVYFHFYLSKYYELGHGTCINLLKPIYLLFV